MSKRVQIRMVLRRLAVALACCFAIPAAARAVDNPDEWPAAPNSAKSGSFGVVQVATVNAREFVAAWKQPTPSVHEKTTTRARRGQTLATFISFRGCQADKRGNCNVTVAYEVRNPAGKLIGQPTLEVWANKPQPQPGLVWLSIQSLNLAFTKADRLGVYTIDATVTDRVAGITLHTRQAHTLSA